MSTIVLLASDGVRARWAHVGDSRLYLFRRDESWTRTRDHSVPEMLFQANEIAETEIRGHPDRNRILRALGHEGDAPAVLGDEIIEEDVVEEVAREQRPGCCRPAMPCRGP